MKWIKINEGLPQAKNKIMKPVYVNTEIKKHGGGAYTSKRVAFYFPEHFKTVEWEDWDDYSEEDFPYTENDSEKGIVWLRPGWYECVNCDNCEHYWSAPLNVIEWLDESPSLSSEEEAIGERKFTLKEALDIWSSGYDRCWYVIGNLQPPNNFFPDQEQYFKDKFGIKI